MALSNSKAFGVATTSKCTIAHRAKPHIIGCRVMRKHAANGRPFEDGRRAGPDCRERPDEQDRADEHQRGRAIQPASPTSQSGGRHANGP